MNELIGLILGLILTLFIYSYLLGDNLLYRLAVHILVGVSAGYAAIVVVRDVILPIYAQVSKDPTSTNSLLWLIPTALALLLIIKRLPATWLGNSPVAFLVGIGAAVALLGAIQGTLLPQVTAVNSENTLLQTILIALLTAITLLSFQFTTFLQTEKEILPQWKRTIAYAGRVILMITFGALFATVLTTSFALFANRLSYFIDQFIQLLS